jgi:hypothetical protein
MITPEWLVSTVEWYQALATPWVGYAIGAAVAGGIVLAVALGLIGSTSTGGEE